MKKIVVAFILIFGGLAVIKYSVVVGLIILAAGLLFMFNK